MTQPMVDLIHIGDYKTGTTWLQTHAFQQHPELIHIDRPRDYPNMANLMYELVDTRDVDFDAGRLRVLFEKEVDHLDAKGRKLVISREALSGDFISGEHAGRIAERLYQVFGPVKILMVIREQSSMIASMYSEYVKMGGTLSLRKFVNDPIVAPHLFRRVDYAPNIAIYKKVFGDENVSVKLFDELVHQRQVFLRDCYALAGCKNVNFQPVDSGSTNLGLTTVGVRILRIVNHFVRSHMNPGERFIPVDRIIALLMSPRLKELLLRRTMVQVPERYLRKNRQFYLLYAINMALLNTMSRMVGRIRVGGKITVPEDVRSELEATIREGNNILVDRYGLKLKEYGWTL